MVQAFLRLLFGTPLLAASLFLLHCNESEVVEQAKYLSVGQSLAVSAPADRVDPALEGKLIHVSARAVAPGEAGVLQDPMLGITAKGLRLKRHVHMYQWKERSESRQQRSGATRAPTSTTVYLYELGWAPGRIDSSAFHTRAGHENPPLLLLPESFDAPKVMLGAYALSRPFVWMLEHGTALPLEPSMLERRSPDLKVPVHFTHATTLFLGQDPRNHQLGDLHIYYQVVPPATVTVVGKQVNGSIEPYEDSRTDRPIHLLMLGEQPLESFFTQLHDSNLEQSWLMRGLGSVLVFVSLLVLVGLLPALTGPLSRWQMLGACLLLCIPFSVLPLGWAWYGFKPVTGVGLMGLGIVGICGALVLTRSWARA